MAGVRGFFLPVNRLTPHEASILGLWLADWHVEAIAAHYGIAPDTVRTIVKVARQKLDGSERLQRRSAPVSASGKEGGP